MVAEDRGQKLGRVAVVALEGRGVGDADDRLLLVVGAEDRLERARARAPGRPAGPPGPLASPRSACGQVDELVPVGLAGEGQHDVRRAVPVGEVVAHLVDLRAP